MPSPGPDMAYGADGLRTGAGRATDAADAADAARARIGAARIGATMFGQVDGADRLVTGVSGTRDGWAQTGRAAHTAHTSLDGRARSTATMGDQLHDETATMAAMADPGPITQGPITQGMQG